MNQHIEDIVKQLEEFGHLHSAECLTFAEEDCDCGMWGIREWLRTTLATFESQIRESERGRMGKLKKKKNKIGFERPGTQMQQIKQRVYAQGYNQAIDDLLTTPSDTLEEDKTNGL